MRGGGSGKGREEAEAACKRMRTGLSKVGGTRRSNHYPYVTTTVGWQKATGSEVLGSEVLGWDDLPQLVIPFRGPFEAFKKKTPMPYLEKEIRQGLPTPFYTGKMEIYEG